jgi:xanthine/uracil permease
MNRTKIDEPMPDESLRSLISWAFLVPGIAGMALSFRRRRALIPLYATIFFITLMYAPYAAEARYTLPARPVLILFAGFTFTLVLEKFASLRMKRIDESPAGA